MTVLYLIKAPATLNERQLRGKYAVLSEAIVNNSDQISLTPHPKCISVVIHMSFKERS